MAKTRTTERKEEELFVCTKCTNTFKQRGNFKRHLGLVHGIDKNDEPVDVSQGRSYC